LVQASQEMFMARVDRGSNVSDIQRTKQTIEN
jgi:hypothetical protein